MVSKTGHLSERTERVAAGCARCVGQAVCGACRGATKADRRRIAELERELRRKEKALAETAALLVLSKKLEAIFHKDADA